jgi:hypothetical protein
VPRDGIVVSATVIAASLNSSPADPFFVDSLTNDVTLHEEAKLMMSSIRRPHRPHVRERVAWNA